MAGSTGKIYARILLHPRVNEDVRNAVEDEIRIAQNKWQVNLTTDELDLVRKSALVQIAEEISNVFKSPFPENSPVGDLFDADDIFVVSPSRPSPARGEVALDFSVLNVLIRSKLHSREVHLDIEEGAEKSFEFMVQRTSSGYIVAEESTEKSIWLKDLPEAVKNLILPWVRTAVFYGVASFR